MSLEKLILKQALYNAAGIKENCFLKKATIPDWQLNLMKSLGITEATTQEKVAPYINPLIGGLSGASLGGLGGYLGHERLGVQDPRLAALYGALGGGALGAAGGQWGPSAYDYIASLFAKPNTTTTGQSGNTTPGGVVKKEMPHIPPID